MFRFLLVAISLLVLAACEPAPVQIRVQVPDAEGRDVPAADQPIVALPYDRDSVIRALEAAAATPRPHTAELDSLFARFRSPFTAYAGLGWRARSVRDSLHRLRDRLDSLPRGEAEYARLYQDFTILSDTLAALERASTPARQALDRARTRVLPRIDSLRRVVALWEDSTFRQYDSLVTALAGTRHPVADTTDADGRATLHLGRGPWWIYTHAWDVTDPYAEWYWNVRVEGDSVTLNRENGRRRQRYGN